MCLLQMLMYYLFSFSKIVIQTVCFLDASLSPTLNPDRCLNLKKKILKLSGTGLSKYLSIK